MQGGNVTPLPVQPRSIPRELDPPLARPSGRARHFANSPPISTGLLGLLTLLGGFVFWPRGIGASAQREFELFLLAILAVMALSEMVLHRTWRQPEAGLGTARREESADTIRILDKMIGIAAFAVIAGVLYFVVPIYQDPWYQRFTARALALAPGLILLVALYVLIVDRLMVAPCDQLHSFGKLLRTFGADGNRRKAADFVLASLVKIFFLPLMYCYGLDDWTFFYNNVQSIQSFTDFYEFGYRFLFFVDVCFAIIGYSVALRVLGSHVRWAERSVKGWVFCLICYAPFWQVIGREYLAYGDDLVWGNLLAGHPAVYRLWGSAILILLCIYVVSTVAFGLRFSNVTYRGTVHRGPYALVRHPAYLSKNLTMWMIQIPFIAVAPAEALGNTLALIGVNLIYLMRARCEEASCSGARDYRLYVRYMRRHGPLDRLARRLRGGMSRALGRLSEV